jgi:adenine-specific DNA-methyltransferase
MVNITRNNVDQLSFTSLPKFQQSNISPLSMQYLGSKARIAGWIIYESKKLFPECNKFYDLFSGTGVVAIEALTKGFTVSANDFEEYSFRVLKSLLTTPRSCLDYLIDQLSDLNHENNLLNADRIFMQELLNEEEFYLKLYEKNNFPWEKYNEFCDNTPIVDGSKEQIDKIRQQKEWNLFSFYYANTYFGIKQCLQLDSLRELAEKLDENLKNHLIAATVSAMTFGVSSTTHLAQYFHPSSRLSTIQLIKRRQYDFISEVQKRLSRLKLFYLPNIHSNVYCLDYLSAIEQENLDDSWIVYADPPYFKEHYSRYYHVLNTFCLYDYPYLTYNPTIKQVTRGRYRSIRNTSDFGKKTSVSDAFLKLFNSCKQKNYRLILSYADTSLVDKHDILRLATEAGLKTVTNETKLMHSSQGKYHNKNVIEYLFGFEAND